jgi:hypothetical protein
MRPGRKSRYRQELAIILTAAFVHSSQKVQQPIKSISTGRKVEVWDIDYRTAK